MKKFVFKLEPVLDMRKRKEENIQVMLGIANSELQKMLSDLEKIHNKKQAYQSEIEIFKASMSQVDDLLLYQNYIDSVEKQIAIMKEEILKMEKKIEEIRALLAQAAKERKMIEKMKEKEMDRYQKEIRLKEINFLDEIGVLRESRKMMNN